MIAMFAAALAVQAINPTELSSIPDYPCEVSDARFNKLNLSGNADYFEIYGTLVANKIGEIRSDWVPASGILFQPSSGKGGVGLQFWVRDPGILAFGVHTLGSSDPQEVGKLPISGSINFQISLSKGGVMDFRVNDRSFELKGVTVDPGHPILMCSGGSFSFVNMRATAPAGSKPNEPPTR